MPTLLHQEKIFSLKVKPLCPVFGECGGCQYQDIDYKEELFLKENFLREKFHSNFNISEEVFVPIVPSPQIYHYRSRLDLKLVRSKKTQEIFIGFSPAKGNWVVEIDACPIAREEISRFIPLLKTQAKERLPLKYKMANLVVRCGDNEKVSWGGIGKKSLRQAQEDYFLTNINNRKIFYSLETFFQANLSILPQVMRAIEGLNILNSQTIFFDFYGGVGLFGVSLADKVKKVYLVEENAASIKLANYNVQYNRLGNVELILGKVEERIEEIKSRLMDANNVIMVDPPRAGLKEDVRNFLVGLEEVGYILYLSCSPDSLLRDLKNFVNKGWKIQKIIPFDFFPQTEHIETLVLLKKGQV